MSIYDEIKQERQRQDVRWGGPKHDDGHEHSDFYDLIRSHLDEAYDLHYINEAAYRRVMIQVAALVVAALEMHDRKNNAG